jgi:hypothetical protein
MRYHLQHNRRRAKLYASYALTLLFVGALVLVLPKMGQPEDLGWFLAMALSPVGLAGFSWWLAAELRCEMHSARQP